MKKVVGEICFGGRLLEDYDIRTMNCIIDMYLNEDVATGNYAFKENSAYRIPAQGTFAELLKHVEGFPETDDYELCNMTPDVTLFGQRNELDKTMRTMQLIELKKNIPDETMMKPEPKMEIMVEKIIEEMPEHGLTKEDINPVVLEQKKGVLYGHHMFALQEMNRHNSLLKRVQDIMGRIKTHMQTGELMTPSLENVYFALVAGRVPEEFIGYSWNHPIGEWIITLKKRIEYIRDWLKAGETKGYWLRALIYPKGLFNALMMYYSQKYEQSVETLSFNFEVTSHTSLSTITEVQSQTAYLYDLYMANAKYNIESGVMEEYNPEEQLKFSGPFKYSKMPIIALSPTNEAKEDRGDFECPVYYLPVKTSKVGELDNMIIKIDCPTDLKSQYWILKEVFMTCIDPALNT